jgi:hypothetical protein
VHAPAEAAPAKRKKAAFRTPLYALLALLAAAVIAAVLFLRPGAKTEEPAPVSEEEQRWLDAKALYDAGDYHAAYAAFKALGGYRDTDAWLLSDPEMSSAAATYRSYRAQFKRYATVQFGRYEQDGDLADGPEPVDWVILWEQGDSVVCISALILDSMPYQAVEWADVDAAAMAMIPEGEAPGSFRGTPAYQELIEEALRQLRATTWESCSLRAWLNSEFLETAFTAKERRCILPMVLTPERIGPEQVTEDRVFALDIGTLKHCFDYDFSCGATEAAKEKLTPCGPGSPDWTYFYWACGSSPKGPQYANVGSDGGDLLIGTLSDAVSEIQVDDPGIGVRPCITLDISAANGQW